MTDLVSRPDPALARCCELLRKHEGIRLAAYPDPATGGDPWTIGYGATGPGIVKGTRWTLERAESELAARVQPMLLRIRELVRQPLPVDAAAALGSLAYNIGCQRPCRNSPPPALDCLTCRLERSAIVTYLNAGNVKAAGAAFDVWNKAAGRVNAVLMRRRAQERAVFESAFRGGA